MLDFVLEHLLVIILVCVVLFIIVPFILKFVSRIMAIAIIVVILGALGIFGQSFMEKVKDPVSATKEYVESTIEPTVKKELDNAEFKYNPETKKYVISSASFKLVGVSDQNKADIVFKDKKYAIDVTFLKKFIEEQIAKQNTN